MRSRSVFIRVCVPAEGAARGVFALACASGLTACTGPGLSAGFDAPDPGARLHALEAAAEADDRSAIPRLVALLESDDPVVRMLSIRTLERMTGTTLQFEHWAPAAERMAGVERWRAYLTEHGSKPSTMPADTDILFHPDGAPSKQAGSGPKGEPTP